VPLQALNRRFLRDAQDRLFRFAQKDGFDWDAPAARLLGKPQVLRLRLRMTFVLGMAIIQDDYCSLSGDC
jgi:hypothetical protein